MYAKPQFCKSLIRTGGNMKSHTRREFLRATAATSALVSFAPVVPQFLLRSCAGKAAKGAAGDRVLVVVQLTGGNDGLNTVVPYGDDEYGRNRPTLRLPTKQLHKIDSLLGFHPRMEAFARLYKEGYLSIVQGVGCREHSRDHEAAMRMWHSADPEPTRQQTGWLGRVADTIAGHDEASVPVVLVSSIKKPLALNAESAVIPTIRSLDDLTIRQMPGRSGSTGTLKAHRRLQADTDNRLLDFLRRRTAGGRAVSRRIKTVTQATASNSDYPSFTLASNLRTVAGLIRADVGIRVFFTELGGEGFGGFDNHANQIGNHCALVHQLSASVSAFVGDLKRDGLLDNVLLMTFSEFGRTVKENGRRGTGHGAAAPVFLAGGRLKNRLVGPHPSLTDLDNGAMKHHTDFRRVFATVLDRWLGYDSKKVLSRQFEPLDILEV